MDPNNKLFFYDCTYIEVIYLYYILLRMKSDVIFSVTEKLFLSDICFQFFSFAAVTYHFKVGFLITNNAVSKYKKLIPLFYY